MLLHIPSLTLLKIINFTCDNLFKVHIYVLHKKDVIIGGIPGAFLNPVGTPNDPKVSLGSFGATTRLKIASGSLLELFLGFLTPRVLRILDFFKNDAGPG